MEKLKQVEEKRAFPRMPTDLFAKIYNDMQVIRGTVTNISRSGMCIKSNERLPINSDSEIFIPLMQDILDINIKVVRFITTDGIYYGMGVEVLNPSKNYFDFIDNFK